VKRGLQNVFIFTYDYVSTQYECTNIFTVMVYYLYLWSTHGYATHTDTAERRPMSAACGGRESGAIGYALQRSRAGLRGWGRPLLC
jgi:hypothetical protein